jgi:hypothetical protein
MIKHLLIGVVFLFTSNLIAQNEKFIGTWQENYHIRKDTLDTGFDEINRHYQAYKRGDYKLSSDYVMYMEVYPENDEDKWEITITKEDEVFWIKTKIGEKEKLIYAPKTNTYYGVFKELWGAKGKLFVEYDRKNKKVVFIEEGTEILVFDFSRKQ